MGNSEFSKGDRVLVCVYDLPVYWWAGVVTQCRRYSDQVLVRAPNGDCSYIYDYSDLELISRKQPKK